MGRTEEKTTTTTTTNKIRERVSVGRGGGRKKFKKFCLQPLLHKSNHKTNNNNNNNKNISKQLSKEAVR